ncbi:hyoscyamine 6-dioxygenase-like [Silene latifolia]|uniref:hyoscyamine 6-dioxygenase-like n=1 Tax=Silene latifolia TaxID=37657 RepID=UPI003D785AE8
MEKLFVSSWCDGETVPENYVFPPELRPGDNLNPKSDITIPIIDLNKLHGSDRASIVNQIMEACIEFGVFQVINHGVSRETMDETRRMFSEFFKLPAEDKSKFISWDQNSIFSLYTSNYNYHEEKIHFWRDVVTQKCHPLEECIPYWPHKPDGYREIIKEYSVKMIELGSRILEVISEGLGLEPGYFGKELSQDAKVNLNHYPPCPDPRLTLGTAKHNDRSLVTILLQGHGNIPGLQYCKDGEWTTIDPSPDALVVFMGHIMKIVSNGKLRSADHQSVTNKTEARESSAFFLCPTQDCVIEPAKALITPENPPLFKSITYTEFLKAHNATRNLKANPEDVVKTFSIKA